jgi:hypothetical protein
MKEETKYCKLYRVRKKDFVKEYLTGFKETFSPHINEAKKFKNEHEPLAIATRLLKKDKMHLYFLLDVDV